MPMCHMKADICQWSLEIIGPKRKIRNQIEWNDVNAVKLVLIFGKMRKGYKNIHSNYETCNCWFKSNESQAWHGEVIMCFWDPSWFEI